ncbi:MAG: TrkA family potassium uptake protein [Eubacterium sp.]|nr:TrkA family potassium uptake protein [Eubacterium sp.]
MAERNYAILGLGRYGMKVATTVVKTGATVLVADSDSEKIDDVGYKFTSAVSFDMTNSKALREIGLENIDVAIIDLAGDLEGSITCIMAAKEAQVELIIATADRSRSVEILKKLGADEVVIPEDESALRLAKSLISEDFMEYTDLGDGLCIIKTPVLEEWNNKSIGKLRLHDQKGLTVVAVVGGDGKLTAEFDAGYVLRAGTPVVLAMQKEKIYDFI